MAASQILAGESVPNTAQLLASNPELRIHQDEYNINVTANHGRRLTSEEVLGHYRAHDGSGHPAHLYIHIPFCSYICRFCNYVKQLLPRDGKEETLDKWISYLIEESRRYQETVEWLPRARIMSFFIGGGTASLLTPRHLGTLLGYLRHHYDFSDCRELTLEGNPDNFQGDLISRAKDVGFNRFSVGVQSLQPGVNEFAGRGHDPVASLRAVEKLKQSRCPFNVDLMFGLPYQTVESVAADVRTLVELGVPTITIYRFRNVERHKMGIGNRSAWNVDDVRERLHRGGYFPDLDTTYRMREAMMAVLLRHDYRPSPCGWWSAPNVYPWGNIPYVSKNKWQDFDTMIALGPGAYGWLTGESSRVIQTHNESDIRTYAKRMEESKDVPLSYGRLLCGWEAVAAALAFAYKANQPIHLDRFLDQYAADLLADEPAASALGELIDKGFMHFDATTRTLVPTLSGEVLHEEIMSVYLHSRIGGYKTATCTR